MAFPESSMPGTPEELTAVLMRDGRALGFSTAFGNVGRVRQGVSLRYIGRKGGHPGYSHCSEHLRYIGREG